jgi:hypothetical protein
MLVTGMRAESASSARLLKQPGLANKKKPHARKINIFPDKKFELNDFIMGMC